MTYNSYTRKAQKDMCAVRNLSSSATYIIIYRRSMTCRNMWWWSETRTKI